MSDYNDDYENDPVLYYAIKEFLLKHPAVDEETIIEKRFLRDDRELEVVCSDNCKYIYDLVTGYSQAYLNGVKENLPHTEDEWRIQFARRLYRQAKLKGWTQDDIADATNISKRTINRYIRAEVTPSAYNIQLLAKALKCSVECLICFDENW